MRPASPPDLATLIGALARRESRGAAASALAEALRGQALLILLPDQDVGALRPAPGFPQTLPGGATWSALLARCGQPGEFRARVAYPDAQSFEDVDVCVASDGAAILLIGAPPGRAGCIAEAGALLLALLRAEEQADAAAAAAQDAAAASLRAGALARSLDLARAQLAQSARALRAALGDAARLNRELTTLNETLEQRVREEIAERMQVEEALRQAQKMEAIGQLTGGVAHDFNNLLTVIIGGLDSIGRQLDADGAAPDLARARRGVRMATQAAQRAATLTARLLAFSRRQALDPKPLHADSLVRELAELLQRTLGETVRLEIVRAPGLWAALADPNELEHTLVNLAVNARDAMPNGGVLTIETGNAWLDEDYLAKVPEPVPPGQYVMIAVSDTGYGMDAETLSHVFEPFFTTKEAGKGTGLGLSQVYGFVRQSGGHVRVYSEPGQGTTVKLYLPRVLTEVTEVMLATPTRDLALLRGAEKVLVVEDDEGVRAFSTGALRDLGYAVVEAADAASALQALDANPDIDLLFTDVVLPGGVHGRKLAEEVTRRRPAVKVLFTSGYTRNAIVHNGRLEAGVQLITKPFTCDELAVRVRKVLDGASGSSRLQAAQQPSTV